MRLVRQLLAGDVEADVATEDTTARAARLLGVAVATFPVDAGAVLVRTFGSERLECVALIDLPGEAMHVLSPSDAAGRGYALAERALRERRIFLLDRQSSDPLVSFLGERGFGLTTVAFIPLYDTREPIGVLVLLTKAGRQLQAADLRSSAPAFHLLGLLLSPARASLTAAAQLADDHAARIAEGENLGLEIEELRTRLREADATVELADTEASSAAASMRAELETARARLAELDATLLHERDVARQGMEKAAALTALEATCSHLRSAADELTAACAERDQRIAELEQELALAKAAPPEPPAEESVLGVLDEERLNELAGAAVAALEAAQAATTDEPEPGLIHPPAIELPSDGASADEDPAAESAAASNADDEETSVPEVLEVAPEPTKPALLVFDSSEEALHCAIQAAAQADAAIWLGEGDLPPLDATVFAVNLFDATLPRAIELMHRPERPHRTVVYGFDPARESGFVIGNAAVLARPIDLPAAIRELRGLTSTKLARVVIVSSQLREVAQLRDRLSVSGVSSSVACDSRQALDLLEIVHRPDVVVIDMTLPRGDAVVLVTQLQANPELGDVPMAIVLPLEVDPAALRSDASRLASGSAPGAAGLKVALSSALAAVVTPV
jgi:CheY-like chemotaxis protein